MDDLNKIIELGVRVTEEALDIHETYNPGAISPMLRVILTTTVQSIAKQAYEAGVDSR